MKIQCVIMSAYFEQYLIATKIKNMTRIRFVQNRQEQKIKMIVLRSITS